MQLGLQKKFLTDIKIKKMSLSKHHKTKIIVFEFISVIYNLKIKNYNFITIKIIEKLKYHKSQRFTIRQNVLELSKYKTIETVEIYIKSLND